MAWGRINPGSHPAVRVALFLGPKKGIPHRVAPSSVEPSVSMVMLRVRLF